MARLLRLDEAAKRLARSGSEVDRQRLREAGLPAIRLHDLRHTMATLMLAQGEHPKIVSERLGHATVGITLDTYSHVLPGLQAAAAENLARYIDEARDHPLTPG